MPIQTLSWWPGAWGERVPPHFVSFVGSNPATWHAVEEKVKNHLTERGELLELTFLEFMCFSKSYSAREGAQRWFPAAPADLPPAASPQYLLALLWALARRTANGGDAVWKGHGWFDQSKCIFPSTELQRKH